MAKKTAKTSIFVKREQYEMFSAVAKKDAAITPSDIMAIS
jgi:hypothetical protein